MKLDHKIIYMGVGAGAGAIISPLLKKYVEPTQPTPYIPGLDTLGIWGTWHVFVPMVSGAALVGVTQFTKLIKKDLMNDTLAMFGFAALFSGLVAGITEMPTTGLQARAASMNRPIARVASATPRAFNGGYPTVTGISGKTIVA
jgi:hypothetical protein